MFIGVDVNGEYHQCIVRHGEHEFYIEPRLDCGFDVTNLKGWVRLSADMLREIREDIINSNINGKQKSLNQKNEAPTK